MEQIKAGSAQRDNIFIDPHAGEIQLQPSATEAGGVLLAHCGEFSRSLGVLEQQAAQVNRLMSELVNAFGKQSRACLLACGQGAVQ